MKSRMISLPDVIEEIISDCEVCYVGMIDREQMPYTLPFNFGYAEETVYLHSAPTGRKIEVLRNNPNVCIAFSTAHQLYKQSEKVACSYGMKYKSVLISGKVEFVEDFDEKIRILNIIMRQYTHSGDFSYNDPAVNNVTVMKVRALKTEAKAFGY
ncbi:pyridoxamine 5'-phosphate oxidase family protein [Lentimicrobium sp.]|uniref:pyridoxamine 5'-phosphate oxidase family protein n=1 Tax=Lentimicrobium sp. TaxID=2034841 RepID=UPI00345E361C